MFAVILKQITFITKIEVKIFLRKLHEFKGNKTMIKYFTTDDKMYLMCSYLAVIHTVKSKKAYTISEE